MAYTLRTKDNAGDVGRAADQNESVDNDIYFNSKVATAYSAWNPDKPPASPNAIDDEFADAAVSGNWTEYDPDAKTTWTEGNGGLFATVANTVGWSVNGLHKAIPAGNFSIYAKVATMSTTVATMYAGIGLWEDPTGDNDIAWWATSHAANHAIQRLSCTPYSNHTTQGAAIVAEFDAGRGPSVYLRLRRNGTDYYCDWSENGVGWYNHSGALALGFVPTKWGPVVDNKNTGVTQYAMFQFMRYLPSDVGLQGILLGDR